MLQEQHFIGRALGELAHQCDNAVCFLFYSQLTDSFKDTSEINFFRLFFVESFPQATLRFSLNFEEILVTYTYCENGGEVCG